MNAQQFISSYLGPRPGLPADFNAGATMQQGITGGQQLTNAQMGSLNPMFTQLADQQYGSIQRIAGGLNNAYTRDARNALTASQGDAQRMSVLGQSLADQSAKGFRTSGPTEIEQQLYRQGQQELALGRALSPEQLRDATQSARQAFSARGLGTGMGAAGAELLNRDAYATARQDQRRQFAAAANQMREENVMSRRDAAGRLGAVAGGMMGDAGTLRQRGALAMTEIDPFSRAIQGGLSLGQSAQGLGMDSIGRNYGEALDFYGNAGTFNINRGDSRYNAWLNNATAAQTGQMSANAQTQAANTQAAATRAARPTWWETTLGAVGRIFSDERMKTDVKPLGKAGNVLGLTAYEFRYKGDKKKRKGFMAQDVQKVLPEAVQEVDYQGKKRLTIKPMVIGAALAEELMAAKAA